MLFYPRIEAFHKETRRIGPIPWDEKEWPDNWKKVEYKEYPRFPSYPLPAPVAPERDFADVLRTRRSRRDFDPAGTLTTQELSNLLHFAAGISHPGEAPEYSFRYYPSGGARYPLELYFAFRGNAEIPCGVYHYNILKHSLEKIGDIEDDAALRSLLTYEWVKDAALLGFITGIFDRNMRKYAERGYRFVLLEAGILLESFYLVSNALGLGCCGVGNNNDEGIERLLDIDGCEEGFIQRFVIGPQR